MKKIIINIILIGVVVLLLSSCTTVQPWERGSLSDPLMIIDQNPIDKGIQLHYIEYKEGSTGATGSQSGGCGCG